MGTCSNSVSRGAIYFPHPSYSVGHPSFFSPVKGALACPPALPPIDRLPLACAAARTVWISFVLPMWWPFKYSILADAEVLHRREGRQGGAADPCQTKKLSN